MSAHCHMLDIQPTLKYTHHTHTPASPTICYLLVHAPVHGGKVSNAILRHNLPQSLPLTSGERCCGLPSRLSLLLSPSLAPSFSLLPLPESSTLCSSSDTTSLPLRGSSPSTTMEEDITGAPLGLDEISGTPPAPTRGLETCSERREQILPLTS